MKELTNHSLEAGRYAPATSMGTGESSETTSTQQEVEVWNEDKTPFNHTLILRSGSFSPKLLFDSEPSHVWYDGILSPSGTYLYSNRILPAGR